MDWETLGLAWTGVSGTALARLVQREIQESDNMTAQLEALRRARRRDAGEDGDVPALTLKENLARYEY